MYEKVTTKYKIYYKIQNIILLKYYNIVMYFVFN